MSPRVTFEYVPGPKKPEAAQVKRPVDRQRERNHLIVSVRDRLERIERRRFGGLTLIDAALEVGLPAGVWGLLGAKRQSIKSVVWQLRGTTPSGFPHQGSDGHLTQDFRETFCGKTIPSTQTHIVTFASKLYPQCRQCLAKLGLDGASMGDES